MNNWNERRTSFVLRAEVKLWKGQEGLRNHRNEDGGMAHEEEAAEMGRSVLVTGIMCEGSRPCLATHLWSVPQGSPMRGAEVLLLMLVECSWGKRKLAVAAEG